MSEWEQGYDKPVLSESRGSARTRLRPVTIYPPALELSRHPALYAVHLLQQHTWGRPGFDVGRKAA